MPGTDAYQRLMREMWA